MKRILSLLTFMCLVFLFSENTHAQGLRYGTLQYRIIDSNATTFTVQFSFYQEWDENATYFLNGGTGVSVGTVDTLPNFYFGDTDVEDLHFPVEAIDNGVLKGTSIFEHEYQKGGALSLSLSLSLSNNKK